MLHHSVNGSRHFEGILTAIHLTHHRIPDDQNTHTEYMKRTIFWHSKICNCFQFSFIMFTCVSLQRFQLLNNFVIKMCEVKLYAEMSEVQVNIILQD
jgi:hypothetical protein